MDANVCEAKSLPKSAMVLSMDKRAGLAEDAVRSTLGGRPVRLLAFGEVVFLIMSNNQCRLGRPPASYQYYLDSLPGVATQVFSP